MGGGADSEDVVNQSEAAKTSNVNSARKKKCKVVYETIRVQCICDRKKTYINLAKSCNEGINREFNLLNKH